MGLLSGLPFVVGLALGHIGGFLLGTLVRWTQVVDQHVLEQAIGRAVSETLRVCTEVDSGETSTTLPQVNLVKFGLPWDYFLIGVVLFLVCCCGIITGLCFYCWRCSRPEGVKDSSPLSDPSPGRALPSLQIIAQQQLAELRVRRHAQQSVGASGV